MQSFNRIIPVLLLDNEKLVKTVKFKNQTYVGDPINAVKIFNDKMVDEIVLLDISATKNKREPDYAKIEEICSEAFMPFAYGGGIRTIAQVRKVFELGIEKVVLNTALAEDLQLVKEATSIFGSQSIVASIDIKKNIFGSYHAYTNSGKSKVDQKLQDYVRSVAEAGVGELFINFIERDGTYQGYDLDLVRKISNWIDVPLIACGGASTINDFKEVIKAGASAAAAGSMFVFRRPHNAVLISYPAYDIIKEINILNEN